MKYIMLEKYPDVLTPDHVIEILNIGRNKVYEMLNNGTIKSIRIGRIVPITLQEVSRRFL